VKWKFVTQYQVYSSPSIAPDGSIVFSGYYSDNNIYCLNATGTLKWKYLMTSYSKTSPVIGANGVVYVASDYLYAIYPSGSLQWISAVSYPQTPVIASTGLVYVGSSTTLFSVGTLLSTLSPSVLPAQSLQLGAAYAKFKGNAKNTVVLLLSFKYLIDLCF
jgi:hypothetical protein